MLESVEGNKLPIEEVDIDANMELAKEFGIRGVPTMVLVDEGGKEVQRIVGVPKPAELADFVSSN
jgi:thioredoxin 1